MTRNREQYWLGIYIERQLAMVPRVIFDCLVTETLGPFARFSDEFPVIDSEVTDKPDAHSFDSSSSASTPAQAAGSLTASAPASASTNAAQGYLSEALILQLGSFVRYKLYHASPDVSTGEVLKCYLYKRYTNPVSFVLLKVDQSAEASAIPPGLAAQMKKKGGSALGADDDGPEGL